MESRKAVHYFKSFNFTKFWSKYIAVKRFPVIITRKIFFSFCFFVQCIFRLEMTLDMKTVTVECFKSNVGC